jgi:hypothetical protein
MTNKPNTDSERAKHAIYMFVTVSTESFIYNIKRPQSPTHLFGLSPSFSEAPGLPPPVSCIVTFCRRIGSLCVSTLSLRRERRTCHLSRGDFQAVAAAAASSCLAASFLLKLCKLLLRRLTGSLSLASSLFLSSLSFKLVAMSFVCQTSNLAMQVILD